MITLKFKEPETPSMAFYAVEKLRPFVHGCRPTLCIVVGEHLVTFNDQHLREYIMPPDTIFNNFHYVDLDIVATPQEG